MTEPNCDAGRIAEVALGTLDGRERAAALAHLEHCPSCRDDLRAYADIADRLVLLTPEAEPPPGFETRVLARRHAGRPRQARRRILPLAIAAALAVVVGVGGYVLGHRQAGSDHPVEAALVAGDRMVGEVLSYQGSPDLLYMDVRGIGASGPVTCRVREADGRSIEVGHFTLVGGTGSWGTEVRQGTSPLATAEIVDSTGRVIASADLQ